MGIQRVVELLRSGRFQEEYNGLVVLRDEGPFRILNYTNYCQIKGPWDEVTTRCRGLIVDTRDWSIAALPFPKFFNVNERGRPETRVENLPREPFRVVEKVDGSMGILWRDQADELRLATRGSFNSEQALRGTEYLRRLPNTADIPNNYTPLFEIVFPGNEGPVISYPYEGLVLLGIMDRFSGTELPWDEVVKLANALGVKLPAVYDCDSVPELIRRAQELPENDEGYVMHFAGGLRLKVKGARYLDLFRLVSSFTKEKVVQAILEGHYDDLYGQVPEEFRHEMVTVRDEFLASVSEFQLKCETAWEAAPKGGPEDKQARKDFALWVRQNAQPNLHGTLFKLYSGDSADYPRILAKQMFA